MAYDLKYTTQVYEDTWKFTKYGFFTAKLRGSFYYFELSLDERSRTTHHFKTLDEGFHQMEVTYFEWHVHKYNKAPVTLKQMMVLHEKNARRQFNKGLYEWLKV